MCMNGFVHAVLELPTSASERKAAPLGENSGLKEPTGRHEIPTWPGRKDGEKLEPLHNMMLQEELFLKVYFQGALQAGFVQPPS